MENVRPSNTASQGGGAQLIEKIQTGSRFLLYTEDPFTYAVKKQGIYLWYKADSSLGSFYWGPVGKKEPSSRRRIKLKNMNSIMIGKQTKGFQSRVAQNAPPSRCFSFIGLKQTLNLQAPDEATLQFWVEAINHILTSAGREVTSEEVDSADGSESQKAPGASAPAASSGRRERRYSVTVNGKMVNEQPAGKVDEASLGGPDGVINWMKEGLSFNNYSLNKKNSNRIEKKSIFLFYSPQGGGSLCWQGSNGQQYILPLHAVSDIFVGKQTKVFLQKAADVLDANCCFSVIGPNVMLNLEAQSPTLLQTWLGGIKTLVERSGKDVIEDTNAAPSAAAASGTEAGGRRMSFMARDKAAGSSETLSQLAKGTQFTSYSDTEPACTVTLHATSDGTLRALRTGEAKAFVTFKVNEISDIFIGKQTPVFKSKKAEKADRMRCFSFKTTTAGSLHLEAPSKGHIELWLKGIKLLLSKQGKDVVMDQNESGSSAGGKQNGRRYSFMKKQEVLTRELIAMKKGQPVTRYTATNAYAATLFVRNACLYLVEGANATDVAEAKEKIRLKKMTDIYVGKQTAVMKSSAAVAKVEASTCFSFVSKKITIDVSFTHRSKGELFLTGIRQILSGTGKKVLLEDGKKQAQQPTGGKERRYSIVGQPGATGASTGTSKQVLLLKEGATFTQYLVNKTGSMDKTQLHLFLNPAAGPMGTLFWCPVGRKVERANFSLPLDRLEEVLVGKQSTTFTHLGAATAEEEQSFTLMGSRGDGAGYDVKVELNVEASSAGVLGTWLEAISALVSSNGMEVQVEGEEDGTAAQAPAEKQRRFSIVDKGAAAAAPKLMTQSGKDSVQMMVRGKMAVLYKLDRQRQAQPKNVFVFFNPAQSKLGVLYWCAPGSREEIRKQSIAFHRITDLFVGKPAEMASSTAASVDEKRCFSIVTKHRSINFEVASPQDVDKWVSGINHVLTSSGLKMTDSISSATGSGKSAASSKHTSHRRSETRRRFSFVAREHLSSVRGDYRLPANIPANPIDAMKQMANRRKTLIDTDNQETIQMMRDGRVFIGYADAGDQEYVKKLLLVFYEPSSKHNGPGKLYWCNPGTHTKSPFACLPLDEITDVFIGKHSEVLKSPVAAGADPRKTFSLIGQHQTIDLEAKTEEELTAFLFGIQSILALGGLKAEELNEAQQNEGEGGYKRRYSIIAQKSTSASSSGAGASRSDGKEHNGSWVGVVGLSGIGSALGARFSKATRDRNSEVEKCYVFDSNAALVTSHEQKHATVATTQLKQLVDADVIFVCLPAQEFKSCIEALKKVLKPQTLVLDVGSGDPSLSKSLGTSLAVMGIKLLDAPIAGGAPAVSAGKAAVMVGGPAKDFVRVRPLLGLLAAKCTHVGPLGSGHAVKAVNMAIAATHLLAASEGMAALSKMGVDLNAALAVVNSSSGRSVLTETILPEHVLSRKFASGYSLSRMEMDVSTGAGIVEKMIPGCKSTLLRSSAPLVQYAAANFDLEADYTELVKVVEESADLEIES